MARTALPTATRTRSAASPPPSWSRPHSGTGTGGVGLSGADETGGAGSSPTVTAPLTDPVTGANPLRSGSSAARLQLTFREPAFQESSVTLSQ